jgi:hypothetical protein
MIAMQRFAGLGSPMPAWTDGIENAENRINPARMTGIWWSSPQKVVHLIVWGINLQSFTHPRGHPSIHRNPVYQIFARIEIRDILDSRWVLFCPPPLDQEMWANKMFCRL